MSSLASAARVQPGSSDRPSSFGLDNRRRRRRHVLTEGGTLLAAEQTWFRLRDRAVHRASIVSLEVPGDHVPATGRVRALRTLVRFLAGMSSLVGAEVIRSTEHLPTDPARVRLDAGVQSHMPGEHVRSGEAPLAHVA